MPDTYFQERMTALGATETDYQGIFSESEKGDIQIRFFGLDGEYVRITRGKDGKSKPYIVTRLHPSRVSDDNKYIRPQRNQEHISAYPWFHPLLIDKYKREAPIPTLFITEGVFKAFKGSLHGLDIIGIQGIQNFSVTLKDGIRDVKKLDPEIESIITKCKVKNIVMLHDADCLAITPDWENDPNKDLYTRPNSFYTSIRNFRELLKSYNVDTYFAHIRAEQLPSNPKGLDDLLISRPSCAQPICQALLSLTSSQFAEMMNITAINLNKIRDYFHIDTPEGFYHFHQEKIGDNNFVFKRTKYKWNSEFERLDLIRAKEADMYIRVGDDYLKRVLKPNRYGKKVPTLTKVLKSTISDDWKTQIPTIFTMIEKYEGFIVAPDHHNYQVVMDGWLNEYRPFLHEPTPGDCDNSLLFVRHIFGEKKIDWQGQEIPMYEIALDYIQLLYQQPREMLPIIILVSEENQTGKGTFKNWLRYIFGENSTEVTIDELDDSFNEAYATKLLIVIDEALVDRAATKERLKYLSTNESIKINPKGLKRYEVDFFGKFMLLSNNEKNCIPIDQHDDRFWIHKVPKPTTSNVHLFSELQEEVPAFLHYLNTRKLAIPTKQTRAWFPHCILDTPARAKMIEFNRSFLEKAIIDVVSGYFQAILSSADPKISCIEEIALDRKTFVDYLKENNFRNWTPHMIGDTLRDKFGIQPRRNGTFERPVIDQVIGLDGDPVKEIRFEKDVNVHYLFHIDAFISKDEIEHYRNMVKPSNDLPF